MRLLISVMLVVGLVVPSASAAPLSPPANLEVTKTGDTVLLEWGAPEDGTPDAYRVYLDGMPTLVVNSTSAVVPPATVYGVTAIYGDIESLPATDVPSITDVLPWWCDPLPTTITDTPPFVDPKPQLHCFNWVTDLVNDLLQKTPAPGVNPGIHLK